MFLMVCDNFHLILIPPKKCINKLVKGVHPSSALRQESTTQNCQEGCMGFFHLSDNRIISHLLSVLHPPKANTPLNFGLLWM